MEHDVRTVSQQEASQIVPGTGADRPVAHERRRPGRPATVNPVLLPLLRGDTLGKAQYLHTGWTRLSSDLDPALGLIVSACIGLALWFAAFEVASRYNS